MAMRDTEIIQAVVFIFWLGTLNKLITESGKQWDQMIALGRIPSLESDLYGP